jgi:RHS repeat-associated protein
MPGRNFMGMEYRFGFNGMEKDDEISGSGNHYTTEFRGYDPRLGRWLSTDPIVHPMYSPYSAFDNNPIYYIDPSGADSENEAKDDLNGENETKQSTGSTGNEQNNKGGGKELKSDQLKDALKGATVEERIKNVDKAFEEGDYLKTKTIFELTNINPEAQEGESKDIAAARGLIKDIDKIVKTKKGFQLQLKEGKSESSQSFPVLKGIDITIKNNSTIQLDVSNASEIIVKTDGLKLGWVGFPDATLSGDKIRVMGIPINLTRKKK